MTSKKITHIVWDWNGTLLDDVGLTVDVLNARLLQKKLPPLTLKQFRERFHFPVNDFYRSIGFKTAQEQEEEMYEWFVEYEQRKQSCSLHDQVEALLLATKERGVTSSILSAHQYESIIESLKQYEILDQFKFVVGSTPGLRGISKLECGEKLCLDLKNLHGIEREKIALIGDSTHDWEVATALGLQCVLVSNGVMNADRLVKHGVPVASSLTEALQTIKVL